MLFGFFFKKQKKNLPFCSVDPNGEAQPLYNEDMSLVLSVNGEIYNHVELREKFCKGMNFRTASDCEVIVHMYERMGADLVQHLDGDFAFILWDSKKKEVCCSSFLSPFCKKFENSTWLLVILWE